jgi:hypothetical protein
MKEIGSIASDDIKIRSSHPISEDWEASGLTGLRMKLALDHHSEASIFDRSLHPGDDKIPLPFVESKAGVKLFLHGSMRPIRTVLAAASDDDDSVFCLVECEERLHESKEEMEAHKKRFGPEKVWDHKAYSIIKFDCLYDDTSRIVTGVSEMRQLGLADLTSIARSPTAPTPEDAADSDAEERRKDFAVSATLQLPGTWDFPTSHLVAYHREMNPSKYPVGEVNKPSPCDIPFTFN